IHTAAFGELHQLVEVSFRGMIEHVLRALGLNQLHAALAACGANHRETEVACQLHGRSADSAAGAVHQNSLGSLGVTALKQSTIGRAVRNAHRRALLEANLVGQAMQLTFIAERLLGIRAAERARDINSVALLHSLDTFSDSFDDTSAIV